MKWMLVVIIMNTPVKTNLTFGSLSNCLSAEEKMRQEWADIYNDVLKSNASKETLKLISEQMGSGTCIPTK